MGGDDGKQKKQRRPRRKKLGAVVSLPDAWSRHPGQPHLVLDTIFQTLPVHTLVARALLDTPALAGTLAQIEAKTQLPRADAVAALSDWVDAGGMVRLVPATDAILGGGGEGTTVYWLNGLPTLKELSKRHAWVKQFAAQEESARLDKQNPTKGALQKLQRKSCPRQRYR